MVAWNETSPAGTDNPKLGDNVIRDFKEGIRERLAIDHDFEETESPAFGETDSTIGEHKQVTLSAPISTPTYAAEKGFLYTKDVGGYAELHFLDEQGNEIQLTTDGSKISAFPSGTIMLFGNNSAPTGWTRKTDWQNNSMFTYAETGDIESGGSMSARSPHSHTGPSHTHTGPSHTHTGPSHTHSSGTLQFETLFYDHSYSGTPFLFGFDTYGNNTSLLVRQGVTSGTSEGTEFAPSSDTTFYTGDGTGASGSGGTGNTGYGGTGSTGSGGTGASGANTQPHYQEVIAATKD